MLKNRWPLSRPSHKPSAIEYVFKCKFDVGCPGFPNAFHFQCRSWLNLNSFLHHPLPFTVKMVQSTFLCTVISVFCHLAWLIRSSSVDPTCYFPDGGIALTYQPCNSTVDRDASVCCELSTSVCGTKGLCYGSNGYIYRGGCTDPSWKSSLCPTICSAGTKLSVKFTGTE